MSQQPSQQHFKARRVEQPEPERVYSIRLTPQRTSEYHMIEPGSVYHGTTWQWEALYRLSNGQTSGVLDSGWADSQEQAKEDAESYVTRVANEHYKSKLWIEQNKVTEYVFKPEVIEDADI